MTQMKIPNIFALKVIKNTLQSSKEMVHYFSNLVPSKLIIRGSMLKHVNILLKTSSPKKRGLIIFDTLIKSHTLISR